ncbi:MAG: transaldolase [Planctomycetota bacterium]
MIDIDCGFEYEYDVTPTNRRTDMAGNPLARLADLGQSVWYDFIRRDLIASGTLAKYIEQDRLAGMTSNPTIFQQAIAGSDLYDEEIRSAPRELAPKALFESLAIKEIRAAADLFRPVYDHTGGKDGHVSLEVAPSLAHDTAATVSEARRLFQACDRPNVMIKIPGTREGLPAIETCLAEGININVTLLFSEERYIDVMEVWLRAMEQRADHGLPVDRVASVASFFVSRSDGKVDKAIDVRLKKLKSAADRSRLSAQKSKLGIANARMAYQAWIRTIRDTPRYHRLREEGAAAQRPLWASTSTKNPSLPDIYYIEALAGPDTVNTVPPHTYEAYRDHGEPEARVEHDLEEAQAAFVTLEEFGIDFAAISSDLEKEGVAGFAESFETLLESITTKREQIDRPA